MVIMNFTGAIVKLPFTKQKLEIFLQQFVCVCIGSLSTFCAIVIYVVLNNVINNCCIVVEIQFTEKNDNNKNTYSKSI